MEVSTRNPYFIEDDDHLDSSLSEMEAGFSGVVSKPSYSRVNSFRNTNYPQSYFRFDNQYTPQPHFLDSCFLCKKPLGDNRDIYMYRGDTPFCSEECREVQIERDEAKEKKQSLSHSVSSAMKRKEQQQSSSTRGYDFHNGTVAAA